jgi:hypothetical protein
MARLARLSSSIKFGKEEESHRYAHVYERQERGGTSRLLIGPARDHCQLVEALAGCLPEPLRLLYVLVVSRRQEHSEARYESPELRRGDVSAFLCSYRTFLESDGRHHLWLANPAAGCIVYDRHEVLYAYGPIASYVAVLEEHGLAEGVVDIPAPHWHAYHPEYDDDERTLLTRWAWVEKPLNEEDQT